MVIKEINTTKKLNDKKFKFIAGKQTNFCFAIMIVKYHSVLIGITSNL